MSRSAYLFWVGVLIAVGGCKSSANKGAKEEVPMHDRPFAEDPLVEESGLLAGGPASAGADVALVGARPDLQLATENPPAACECLAVHLGKANDPQFFWQSGAPRIGSDQLVVAVTSAGVPCPAAAEDSLGASYWGFRQEGADVVVVVEQSRDGRPMTTGAIIPRPGPGGAVYIAPQNARIPYGRPLTRGERYCRVSEPSPVGATP